MSPHPVSALRQRYACGHGFVAAEVMEANVDCLQVVPRPEDVGARFGWTFVGGRE